MIKLGFYKHWKSGHIYEVTNIATNANNGADLEPVIVYRNVKTRCVYTRGLTEFEELVQRGGDSPRFELVSALDSPLQLFVETLRLNRFEYLKMGMENPLFYSHGGHSSLKYILGDKIGFARMLRVINTDTANKLIKWLNYWKQGTDTGHEKLMLYSDDNYKKLVGILKSAISERRLASDQKIRVNKTKKLICHSSECNNMPTFAILDERIDLCCCTRCVPIYWMHDDTLVRLSSVEPLSIDPYHGG